MYKILYFSPTGNTSVLAERLAKNLDTETIIPIEHNFDIDLGEDKLIIMYPIHGFNPPRTVLRFIKQVPNSNNQVYLIAVGCNTTWANEAVHSGISKRLSKKGFNVLREDILAMPLTLVMDFKKDMKIQLIHEAYTAIDKLAKHIKEEVSHRDRFVCAKAKILSTIGKLESPAARLFGLELHANKNCTSCGLCVKECPEQNIKMKKKPKFGFKCSMCLRCVYQCPEHAISPYISKFITIKGGYNIHEFIEKEDSLN